MAAAQPAVHIDKNANARRLCTKAQSFLQKWREAKIFKPPKESDLVAAYEEFVTYWNALMELVKPHAEQPHRRSTLSVTDKTAENKQSVGKSLESMFLSASTPRAWRTHLPKQRSPKSPVSLHYSQMLG